MKEEVKLYVKPMLVCCQSTFVSPLSEHRMNEGTEGGVKGSEGGVCQRFRIEEQYLVRRVLM